MMMVVAVMIPQIVLVNVVVTQKLMNAVFVMVEVLMMMVVVVMMPLIVLVMVVVKETLLIGEL